MMRSAAMPASAQPLLTPTRLAAGAIGKLDRAESENSKSIPAPTAEVRAGNRKIQ
jgi:hypothetical protein